jgi:hypothetical protein
VKRDDEIDETMPLSCGTISERFAEKKMVETYSVSELPSTPQTVKRDDRTDEATVLRCGMFS